MTTFNPIFLPQNQGLGNVLRLAINTASYDIIARMDSDDVAACNRFEKQLSYLNAHPEVSIVGSNITEYIGDESNIVARRMVPEQYGDIRHYMKRRCPFNHMTVLYRKEEVLRAGNYQHWFWNEDYFLWTRIQLAGSVFGNLKENLVNVLVGKDMYARRGGWKYFCSEAAIQGHMLTHQIISFPLYLYNTALRFGGQVVLPNCLRAKVFKMMRQKPQAVQGETVVSDSVQSSEMSLKINHSLPPFSVAISVYKNDNPEWFDKALESIIVNQTVKPAEVVLVVDGPVPKAIHQVINKYKEICLGMDGITLIVNQLDKNGGLGNALRIAAETASCALIARMDSDDYSYPDRFEKQLNAFAADPSLDIVGGNMSEFIDDIGNVVGTRPCPLSDGEIKRYMTTRCGFNHITVMYKKAAVLGVGNYQDWFWNEDYYLWIRMMQCGCKFANLPDVLASARVSLDMYKRRGGKKYFDSEAGLQRYMYQHGLISYPKMLINITIRFVIQCMIPNTLRGFIFQKLFRKK